MRDPNALKVDQQLQRHKSQQQKRLKEHPLNKPIPAGADERVLQNKKLLDLAEEIGIDPDGPLLGNLWAAVKGANGFQIRKTRGGGKKNTPADTWRNDLFNLAKVACYMHEHGVKKTKASELCGIHRRVFAESLKRQPLQWELFRNDEKAARNNLEMLEPLGDRFF